MIGWIYFPLSIRDGFHDCLICRFLKAGADRAGMEELDMDGEKAAILEFAYCRGNESDSEY